MFQKNTKTLITNKITKKALQIGGFSWFLQESNQGHTDFQSVALPTELRNLDFNLWFLQESNQGHTDFQSVALPTELRNLFIFWWCKCINFY